MYIEQEWHYKNYFVSVFGLAFSTFFAAPFTAFLTSFFAFCTFPPTVFFSLLFASPPVVFFFVGADAVFLVLVPDEGVFFTPELDFLRGTGAGVGWVSTTRGLELPVADRV